jgi:hypothetical protein
MGMTITMRLVMSSPKYLSLIQSQQAGTFLKLSVKRPMKMKKGQPQLFKSWDAVVRAGVNYDNIKVVQEARADGSLPEENQGLRGGQSWHTFPYVIQKVDGSFDYRFTRNGTKKPNSVILDAKGNKVEKEVAKEMAYSSEFSSGDTPVFQVNEGYITSIMEIPVEEIVD